MTTPPANSGPYRYQPFPAFGGPHIRIATILPGQFHDDVSVMLRLVKFKANTNRDSWVRKRLKFGKEKQEKGSTSWPHYEALSYVWGPVEEHSAKIRVSHLSRYGTQLGGWLPARRNLMSALRHLRRADRPRDLWIDAICIDQDDDVAKGPQVAMMGDIYQRAASVVVWLGPGTQNTPSAFAWLEDFASQFSIVWETMMISTNNSKAAGDLLALVNQQGSQLEGLQEIFSSQWFRRLWVRQEINLATRYSAVVQCGHSAMAWTAFLAAWLKLDLEDKTIDGRLKDYLDETSGFAHMSTGSGCPLPDVRRRFGKSSCFDERDRIYAIRALLDPIFRNSIQPDYTKSAVEVFRAVTVTELSSFGASILSQCQFTPAWTGPSWVPNWAFDNGTHRDASPIVSMASGSFRMIPSLKEPGSTELLVQGVEVSTVERFSDLRLPSGQATLSSSDSDSAWVTAIQEMIQAKHRELLTTRYPHQLAGGTLLDAYVYVLSGGMLRAYFPGMFPNHEQARAFFTDRAEPGNTSKSNHIFLRQVYYICLNSRIFFTADGHIGLAPEAALPGDKVAVVVGCRSPILLRPSGQGPEPSYQVIGACFVAGLMLGEGLLGPLPEDVWVVWTRGEDDDWGGDGEPPIGWFYINRTTRRAQREDPRLQGLGLDLAEFRRSLATISTKQILLDVEPKTLREGLGKRGITLKEFRLV
ncbi:heterokaryon incompatibility protein-domain-containing protein [Phyllosticta capitalensis]|uniref:Heterokaryon incompatibility protein-domain-containing protein n=1 Tax=Phyllosticta capitalensis TaxID=121624 RepID=A0ABR1Y9U5_9PEZI